LSTLTRVSCNRCKVMMPSLQVSLLMPIFCIAKDALGGVIGSELVQYIAGFAFTMDTCNDLATIGNQA
jgi:hypothetical protein